MKIVLISLEIKWFTALDVSDTQVELVGRWKLSCFGKFVQDLHACLTCCPQTFYAKQKLFRLLLKPFYPVSKLTLFAFESVQSIETNLGRWATLGLKPLIKSKQFIVLLISGSARCCGIFLIRLLLKIKVHKILSNFISIVVLRVHVTTCDVLLSCNPGVIKEFSRCSVVKKYSLKKVCSFLKSFLRRLHIRFLTLL